MLGLAGGTNLYNSILTGAVKEVVSNFTGNFASNYWSSGNFNQSVKDAENPTSLVMSAVSGGLSGALEFKTQSAEINTTNSPLLNSLELQTLPYLMPLPNQIVPVFKIVPPNFEIKTIKNRWRVKLKN
jgi:hypothetical protein